MKLRLNMESILCFPFMFIVQSLPSHYPFAINLQYWVCTTVSAYIKYHVDRYMYVLINGYSHVIWGKLSIIQTNIFTSGWSHYHADIMMGWFCKVNSKLLNLIANIPVSNSHQCSSESWPGMHSGGWTLNQPVAVQAWLVGRISFTASSKVKSVVTAISMLFLYW